MNLFCFLVVWVLAVFTPIPQALAAGSPTIRVALAQEARQLQVNASESVTLVFPSGQRSTGDVPLILSPRGRQLVINGLAVDQNRVRIDNDGGGLAVTVQSGPAAKRDWLVGGRLTVVNHHGLLMLINEISLEEYVAGVVASEVNPEWHPEVLKVQAVAARTYALHKALENGEREFDVVASVQDQVYQGIANRNRAVRQAVKRTTGLIVTHDQAPIFAAYSSTVAGRTEDASNVWAIDLPYLKGVDCPFDENSPRYRWEARLSVDMIERALRKEGLMVGTIATMAPYAYSQAGRVNQIRILHSLGALMLGSQEFRRIVGYGRILSTQFEIQSLGSELVLVGKGSGHAVGLCQWGAKEMAELGYPFQAILAYFYPGTELMNVRALPRLASRF